jgi:CMP/dCMP kinase
MINLIKMENVMIITIDGPIATGKSTIAKKLAEEIGYIYFDTGAMYRCLTYGIIKKNVNFNEPEQLATYLKDFLCDIRIKRGDRHYYFEGEEISSKIRLEEVTKLVSQVSALKAVREKLVALQRELSVGVNAVFEGRDMGTVVFPAAQLKIFLTGRPEVRAKRRFDELKSKFPNETADLTLEKTLEQINQRDNWDMNREVSPLKKADDALEVDTSDLSIDEIVMKILEYKDTIKTRIKSTVSNNGSHTNI